MTCLQLACCNLLPRGKERLQALCMDGSLQASLHLADLPAVTEFLNAGSMKGPMLEHEEHIPELAAALPG